MKISRSILLVLPVLVMLLSCSVQKRHYRKGYYFEAGHGSVSAQRLKIFPMKTSSPERIFTLTPVAKEKEQKASSEKTAVKTNLPPASKHSRKFSIPRILKSFAALDRPVKKAFYTGVQPNAVAKAALRLMLVGLLFLGLAGYFLLQFPELAYVTVTLLIITTIFAAVAAFSAFNARQDKINNSETWLKISLLSLVLSLLIICAAVLFLILLF